MYYNEISFFLSDSFNEGSHDITQLIVTLNRTQPPLQHYFTFILHSYLYHHVSSCISTSTVDTTLFSNGSVDMITVGYLELLLLCIIFPVILFQEQR